MKPIAIFQHEADAPPGYFAEWLDERGLGYETVRIDAGVAVPQTVEPYGGLCFMGGSMSVNDPLPFIEAECHLIREADARGIPVIGHCLGGQLLARALGATVMKQPVKEIGWHMLAVSDRALAEEWLGVDAPSAVELFQWHGDSFALPAGARNFLSSAYCSHQAYVIDRGAYAHLGMQFHCEMTPTLVRDWSSSGTEEIEAERSAGRGASVQDAAQMRHDLPTRTARMNALAARLYARWARGLVCG